MRRVQGVRIDDVSQMYHLHTKIPFVWVGTDTNGSRHAIHVWINDKSEGLELFEILRQAKEIGGDDEAIHLS
jgi:hypothetical protein